MTTYGQFCPVSKAMELLDERWTMLVIRGLLMGSRHLNDLRRGVPRMSPALLSTRLRTLARAGLVERREAGGRISYTLTEAGEELRPIVVALGEWGTRWVPDLGDADLDPHLLMWDVHRNVDLDAVPPGRTVLDFTFTDVAGKARTWWLVIDPDGVDVRDVDPGHPVRGDGGDRPTHAHRHLARRAGLDRGAAVRRAGGARAGAGGPRAAALAQAVQLRRRPRPARAG